jgi:polar amino acid transport system permease protein
MVTEAKNTSENSQPPDDTDTRAPEPERGLERSRRRHVGSWVVAALVLWLVFVVGRSLASSPNIDWRAVRHYLFAPEIIAGLERTLLLTATAMSIAIVVGILVAMMRLSSNRVARGAAFGYVYIFRAIPTLLLLIITYNLAIVFPRLSLGIPGAGISFASWDTNTVISIFGAALLGLGISESAYYSEIVRAGLLSVNRTQTEAAQAIGMSELQIFRFVVFPQAMRTIIPPTGNELIGMLKYSSLASVISYNELLDSAQQIYATNLLTIELLIVITLWYVTCVTLLSIVQYFIERRYGRGFGAPASPLRSILTSTLLRRGI